MITPWQVTPLLSAMAVLMNAFGITGAIGICLGTALATIADRFPAQRSRLQYCGGAFLIGGITLVALTAPMI
jgi:hypothetical protein